MATDLRKTLECDGAALVEGLASPQQLRSMQEAFRARLRWLRLSNADGYEQTELYRHMVQDVLTLDPGFLQLALHPIVIEALGEYLGGRFRLTEAKGWRSLPTRRDFHGWHGDAWYDQERAGDIPREVKLGFYLTDVSSGEFQYVRGSHRQQHPRMFSDSEVDGLDPSRILKATGPAGTAILFDTSGIHRQAVPIPEERHAVFFNYHDPGVPLQQEDVAYYRYHPLLLNAAFLGDLSAEQERTLGFGDYSHYLHAFQRSVRFSRLQRSFEMAWRLRLRAEELSQRVSARLRRV